MKKLTIFLLAFIFLSVLSCKDDDPVEYKIVGGWKPTQMVKNTVDNNNVTTATETITFNECEQASRWIFNENLTGKRIEKTWLNGNTCVETRNSDFNYTYEKSDGIVYFNYVTGNEEAKITDLTESTMNLRMEEITPSGYISRTYSLVKIY